MKKNNQGSKPAKPKVSSKVKLLAVLMFVMPGVLIIEAMAQTAILVGSAGRSDSERGQVVLLVGVDDKLCA